MSDKTQITQEEVPKEELEILDEKKSQEIAEKIIGEEEVSYHSEAF